MNNFRNILVLLIILFASFLIQGCFYLPQSVPNIKGVLVRDGKAVTGATVKFIRLKNLKPKEQEKGKIKSVSKTDTDGSFNIIGKRGLGIRIPVPAEYLVCWKLCFYEDDGTISCWDVKSIGPPYPPEFIKVECDLNSVNICKVIESSYKYFRNQLEK